MVELVEKNPARNILVALALASSGYSIGYYVSIMNSMAGPMLDGAFKLSREERISTVGNLNSFFALGAALGVLFGSKIMDKIGRRKTNMLLDVLSIVVIALMAVKNLTLFTLLRFLMGFNSSTYIMVQGITLVEIYPLALGAIGNMINYSILTGCILLTFVQQIAFSYQTLRDNWQLFMCYPIAIPIVRLVILQFFMNYDSPVFILAKFKDDPNLKLELKGSLAEVYTEFGLDEHIDELVLKSKETAQEVSLLEIFGPSYRKALVSGMIGLIGQQLTGISFLVFFSTELFDRISGTGKTISFVFGAGNFGASFLGIYIINRFARTYILKVGAVLQGIALLLLLIFIWLETYLLLPLCILFYIISYSVSFGGTVPLYVNEILPPSGVGLCVAVCWTTASVIGKFCPLGVEVFGSNGMILFFAVSCVALGAIVDRFCLDNSGLASAKNEERIHELTDKILAK